MKRIFTVVATLAIGLALSGVVPQLSPTARTVLAWTALPRAEKTVSTPAAVKDASGLSENNRETDEAARGLITMTTERIEAQEIEVAPAGKGVLARVLTVPGTITLDPGRVARVPGRVEGTVTQMRKRLGDLVTAGEVI